MSVVMLVLGTVAVGALFFRVMAGFFVPLFLAALLVVIFRPFYGWIDRRLGGRPRVAALGTTGVVLTIVLLPILLVLLVAATQFTAMVSRLNLQIVSSAVERGRERLSLTLPHAERFRTLEAIVVELDDTDDRQRALDRIRRAGQLVSFLQANVDGPPAAEAEAEAVRQRLEEFAEALRERRGDSDSKTDLNSEGDNGAADAEGSDDARSEFEPPPLLSSDRFDEYSIRSAAAIRNWRNTLLGGSVWSQLRLLANPAEEDFAKLVRMARETLQPRFVQLTGATGGLVVELTLGIMVMVIATYYFLLDGPGMVQTLMRLSPLDDDYERRLLGEFDRTSRAVVLASVLSALAQGAIATPAYYVLGFQSVVFLFLITTMMALVPFVGAAAVWGPCVVWLAAAEGRIGAALGLAIYGTVIVSSTDNVIKMFVLHGRSQLHPLLALLSVLGGVAVFGPIGILVGPMVVVFLQSLLEILNQELGAN